LGGAVVREKVPMGVRTRKTKARGERPHRRGQGVLKAGGMDRHGEGGELAKNGGGEGKTGQKGQVKKKWVGVD